MNNHKFVIKAVLSGQRLNISIPLLVSGTIAYVGIEATASVEWADCTIICSIKKVGDVAYSSYVLTYDPQSGKCYFFTNTKVTLNAGEYEIWFVGIQYENYDIYYRITTESKIIRVLANGYYDQITPAEELPLYEQAIAIAGQAKQTADEIMELYETGQLMGPPGPPGTAAQIISVQSEYEELDPPIPWVSVINTGSTTEAELLFKFYNMKAKDAPTDYILVQDEEPNSPTNKMWIKDNNDNRIRIYTADECDMLFSETFGTYNEETVESVDKGACTFSAPGEFPIIDMEIQIGPVQEGDGDPSSSNIRDFTGFTQCRVNVLSENITGGLTRYRQLNSVTGEMVTTSTADYYCSSFIPAKNYFYVDIQIAASGTRYMCVNAYDKSNNFLANVHYATKSKSAHVILNLALPEGTEYVRYSLGKGPNGKVYYAAGNTGYITFDWSDIGDIYAGSFNPITGEIKVLPYYASYNNEALVGPWLSDRDVYSAEASPTVGAKVIDLGGQPTKYQIQGTEILTNKGDNNIISRIGSPYAYTDLSVTFGAYIKAVQNHADRLYNDIRNNIAPVEQENTSTRAYSQGEYFFLDKAFCKAKTSIAIGATFTLGTNYEETTIGAELFAALNP